MAHVDVSNRQQRLTIDERALAHACGLVLAGAECESATLSVVVVDNDEMQILNRDYLEHDYPTDVLSFPLSDDGEPLQGEIILSAGTASTNAAEYGTEPLEELLLYAIHGTLHLVGLDDKSPDEAKKMRSAEAYWLQECDLPADRVNQLVYPQSKNGDRWSRDVAEEIRQ